MNQKTACNIMIVIIMLFIAANQIAAFTCPQNSLVFVFHIALTGHFVSLFAELVIKPVEFQSIKFADLFTNIKWKRACQECCNTQKTTI